MTHVPWDKPSLVFGFTIGIMLMYVVYTTQNFLDKKKLHWKVCDLCGKRYEREKSTSQYQHSQCSIACEFLSLVNFVVRGGKYSPDVAAQIISSSDERFAQFNAKTGSS